MTTVINPEQLAAALVKTIDARSTQIVQANLEAFARAQTAGVQRAVDQLCLELRLANRRIELLEERSGETVKTIERDEHGELSRIHEKSR